MSSGLAVLLLVALTALLHHAPQKEQHDVRVCPEDY